MRNAFKSSCIYSLALAATLLCVSFLLAGCGNSPFVPGAGSGTVTVSGLAKGGEMPISGGTVTLYATAANATGSSNGIYTGGQATILGQTTSLSTGAFSITVAAPCAAPNVMYATVTGGSADTGSDINSDIVLMAIVGACTGSATSYVTNINEVTTVATAYALSAFTNVTSSCTNNSFTASPCVNITSDITNYDGLYSAGSYAGVGSTSAGMGLIHAVANANNLATMSTGVANSLTTTSTGTVPTAEINTLADILQVCVNSAGGQPVANTTSSAVATPTATTAPAATTQSKSTITGFPNSFTGINGTLAIALNGGTAVSGTFSGITSPQAFVNAFNTNTNFTNAVANVTTTSLTVGTATAVSTFDITGFTPTSGLTGTLTLTLGSTLLAAQTISGTTPANIINAINTNSVFAAQPTIAFSTPTASSSSAYSTSTLSGIGTTNGLNGSINIAVGSGSAVTYNIGSNTTAATFITAFNAAVPSSVAVASASGAAVLITGAVKATGSTLSFPSNTLVSNTGVVHAALSGTAGIIVTSPSGTANVISVVAKSFTGTAGGYTLSASTSGPVAVVITGPNGTNAVTFTGTSLTTTPAYAAGSTNCGALFNATPTFTGTLPTNTLQAVLNLAKNPYSGPTNLAALFALVPGTGAAFTPTLSASPADWTMAITYNNANTGIVYPYWLATDAGDDMYLENLSASTSTYLKIVALSSNGTLISPSGGWVPSNSATAIAPRGIAPDSLGNLWVADNATTTLNEYSTTNGNLTASYQRSNAPGSMWGVAVDKLNNIWLSYIYSANGNIDELIDSSGTYAFATGGTNNNGTLEQGTNAPYNFAIDQNQNIWSGGYYSTGNTVGTVVNQTPASTASYTANSMLNTVVGATTGSEPFGIAIDSSGNAWTDLYAGLGIVELTPTLTSGVITAVTAGSQISALTLVGSEGMTIDGNNQLWIADNGSSSQGLLVYNTVSGIAISPPTGYKGCFVSGTTCGATSLGAIYDPRYTAIDSTGSVWAGITAGGLGQTSLGGVTQMIGTAAPAWPLRSTGKPGVMP